MLHVKKGGRIRSPDMRNNKKESGEESKKNERIKWLYKKMVNDPRIRVLENESLGK